MLHGTSCVAPYLPWSFGFDASPTIASARPLVGPSGPCTIVVVCACLELTNGLLLACIPSSGLLRLGWQQLDTHLMGWVQIGLIRCPDGALGRVLSGEQSDVSRGVEFSGSVGA